MDFSITEEQSMLADSVSRYIDNKYDFESRMKIAEGEAPFSEAVWTECAGFGWNAMLFPEADGGFDGDATELMLIMEQFGRGLVVEPFLANVVLAGGVLKRAADGAQREAWISGLIDGSRQMALAFAEPQARYDIANVSTSAKKDGDDWIISGHKTLVLNGGAAEVLIVPARTAGEQSDEAGISLFAVDAKADGVSRKAYKTVDAHGAADIALKDVRVPADALIGKQDDGFAALSGAVTDATLAVCAEAIGILSTLQDKTVEYSKQRVQFGVPIGTFQALQHRMVDTLMACEQMRSLLYRAVMLRVDNDPDADRAISELKYLVGTSGRHVAQEAVQIHGGMGVTWELDVAHYFKRLTAINILFGNADWHLDRVAGLS